MINIMADLVVPNRHQCLPQQDWILEEEQPWWRVDLGDTHNVNEIVIYNRTDEDVEQLSDYTVTLVDAAGNVVWNSVQKDSPNPSLTIPLPDVEGRFVKIQLNGKGALALAEVIVKGK